MALKFILNFTHIALAATRVLFTGCKMKEGFTLVGVFMEGTTFTF
jgi:hypothetical protein